MGFDHSIRTHNIPLNPSATRGAGPAMCKCDLHKGNQPLPAEHADDGKLLLKFKFVKFGFEAEL